MRVYLDTNCVIYLVENHPAWCPKVTARVTAMRAAGDELAVGDLSRAECLVAPFKNRDAGLEARYRTFFNDPEVHRSPSRFRFPALLTWPAPLTWRAAAAGAASIHVGPGRPEVGKGSVIVPVSLEAGLLRRAVAFARDAGVKRLEPAARALKLLVDGTTEIGGRESPFGRRGNGIKKSKATART